MKLKDDKRIKKKMKRARKEIFKMDKILKDIERQNAGE